MGVITHYIENGIPERIRIPEPLPGDSLDGHARKTDEHENKTSKKCDTFHPSMKSGNNLRR